jgi:hypothetical protein
MSALKATGPHGYSRLHVDNVPVLTPWRAGAGLPGNCRGHVLTLAGQTMLPTGGLQRSSALECDAPGYSLTLCAAAKGLAFSFENIGNESVDIFAWPGWDWTGHYRDSIDGASNETPFAVEAGASVTLSCQVNGRWVTE